MQKWDVLAITDEIYEHIIYDGAKHISPITLDGMRERTIVVNGMSKTYSVTGWRVGYIIAPPGITGAIRKMHDFMTVGAPAPLQEAGAVALRLPDSYYSELAAHYPVRRDRLLGVLKSAGLEPFVPSGRVLHHVQYRPYARTTGVGRRCGVYPIPGDGHWGGGGSRKQLFQGSGVREELDSIYLL